MSIVPSRQNCAEPWMAQSPGTRQESALVSYKCWQCCWESCWLGICPWQRGGRLRVPLSWLG